MAKRRKLETPSLDDMARIEDEFRRETPARPLGAPISQIAADAAQSSTPETSAVRAERAKDKADAQVLRDAKADGLLLMEVPLAEIDPEAMVRDRTLLDAAEMEELKSSIGSNGLRLPIEIFDLAQPGIDGPRYGLLSGYRRLRAVQMLVAEGKAPSVIKAILRAPDVMGGAFAAMVEENEVRANLSHFERGRIAVIAAQQGAFGSVAEAVNGLFPVASKAKRSKIRSFSVIFEELGDLLSFPEALKERDGLWLSAVLRTGGQGDVRAALEAGQGGTAGDEWQLIREVLDAHEAQAVVDASKGGRPKTKRAAPVDKRMTEVQLSNGIVLQKSQDASGFIIRLEGAVLDANFVDAFIEEAKEILERR